MPAEFFPDWPKQAVALSIAYVLAFVVSLSEQLRKNAETRRFPLLVNANISGWVSVGMSALIFDRVGDQLVQLVVSPIAVGLAGSRATLVFSRLADVMAAQKLAGGGHPTADEDLDDPPHPRARKPARKPPAPGPKGDP